MAEEKFIDNIDALTDEELDSVVGGANVLFYETGTHHGFQGRECHSLLSFSGSDDILKKLMSGGSVGPADGGVVISHKSISPKMLDDFIARKKAAGYTIIAVDKLPF